MHISDLPDRSQDYLKAIFDCQEWSGEGAGLKNLADKVGQRPSTASEAIKRLAAQGLVVHEPYAPIVLTDLGKKLAVQMVRRHRLIETYLCRELGYSMDEVHAEAEVLEHAVSDKFLRRISAHMGYPTRDPHGDPIPDEQGNLAQSETHSLADAKEGDTVKVERISDRDTELLRHLETNGVLPGVLLRVKPRPYADLAEFTVNVGTNEEKTVTLPAASLAAVRCSQPNDDD